MNAVTATEIVLSYGATVAIDTSTFSIPRGAITAVIGPNGSGKSTLLNAIAGLHKPDSGSIELTPLHGRSAMVAHVLQTTKVNETLPVTVREVVRMGRYATAGAYGWLGVEDREAVDAAMRRTDVFDLADRHIHELSAGQRQRVFVSQGLAQDHDLLLLDEPLTGLDLPSARAVDDVIHDEHSRGCTVVMTTHDLAEAGVADHAILLSSRVIASGPPSEVLTVDHLTAAYGPSLLHIDGQQLFIDDPAHRPVSGRHIHRDRTIHIESSTTDRHPD